jgi:nucleoside-diphosphate-sugar epimerase
MTTASSTTTTFTKPILITGGTGKVGSRLIPRVLAQGEPVRALVRDPESEAALQLRRAGAELVVGDLTTLAEADMKPIVDGTSAVIHLVAAFRGGESPERSAAVNTDAAVTLAQAALDAGVQRFVFTSTNLIYGSGHTAPQREDVELRPLPSEAPYPITKRAAEKALRELHATGGLDLRIVRLPFVYGDGDPHIEEFMNRPLEMHPANRLQMAHHADVAQGLLLALRAEGVTGEVFNIADDSAATLAEIYRYMGRDLTPEMAKRTIRDPWFGMVETTKARRVLGFRPLYPTMWQAVDAGVM